jgi:hypothetical protein
MHGLYAIPQNHPKIGINPSIPLPLPGVTQGDFLKAAFVHNVRASGMQMPSHYGHGLKSTMPIISQNGAAPGSESRDSGYSDQIGAHRPMVD